MSILIPTKPVRKEWKDISFDVKKGLSIDYRRKKQRLKKLGRIVIVYKCGHCYPVTKELSGKLVIYVYRDYVCDDCSLIKFKEVV